MMGKLSTIGAGLFLLSAASCGGATSQGDCDTNTCTATPTQGTDSTGGGVGPVSPPSLASTPVDGELVSRLYAPAFLALDDANVYFASATSDRRSETVYACPKSGCPSGATALAPAVWVTGVVTDGAEVFFADVEGGGVKACAVSGCNGQPRIVAPVIKPMTLALANDTLYWTTLAGEIQRCAKNCTTPETIATDGGNGFLWGLTVSGTNVYWARAGMYDGTGFTGAIRTCSTVGACVPRTLADRQSSAHGVATDGNVLAWTSDGDSTARRCTLPDCNDATAMPVAGQQGVTVAGGRIYWSYGTGAWIQSATSAGTQTSAFVTGQSATYLAADATNLFWIDTDIPDSRGGNPGSGRIVRAPLVTP